MAEIIVMDIHLDRHKNLRPNPDRPIVLGATSKYQTTKTRELIIVLVGSFSFFVNTVYKDIKTIHVKFQFPLGPPSSNPRLINY